MRWAWIVLAGSALPVLAQQAEEDIRGPKPLIEIPVPEPPTPWLNYGLWGVLALLAIAAVIWWWWRRKGPEVSAEDQARRLLDGLEKEGAALAAGDFALAASQVVRDFIRGRFGLAAPKWTTEEFLQRLATQDIETLRSRMEPLRGFLRSCDMAKFAGADLDVGERGRLLASARAFVDGREREDGKEAA